MALKPCKGGYTVDFKARLALFSITILCSLSCIVSAQALSFIPQVELFDRVITFSREPMLVNGRMLVPANEFMQSIHGSHTLMKERNLIRIQREQYIVDLYLHRPVAVIDGQEILLDTVTKINRDVAMIPLRFICDSLGLGVLWDENEQCVLILDKEEARLRSSQLQLMRLSTQAIQIRGSYRIVIDAGHGGNETGAIAYGVMEKNLNLDIAIRLERLLRNSGVKTYMTRWDDRDVGLYYRSGLANSVGADLFVSIHNNAGMRATKGSMTLYHPANSLAPKGGFHTYEAARNIQQALLQQLGTINLGLIQRPYLAVLRTTHMPAVLVEVGYMTNSGELNKLLSASYRQSAAEAIKEGILKTLKSGESS